MTPSVGRPRVSVKPEQVRQLKNQGASWRQIAKALGIGTATAMRLFLRDDGVPSPEDLYITQGNGASQRANKKLIVRVVGRIRHLRRRS